MTFSQSFLDRYKDNAEMQEVIQNADARLVGASISDADKETIYESLYGFKHAIADKYGFDMDPIYDKLEKLNWNMFNFFCKKTIVYSILSFLHNVTRAKIHLWYCISQINNLRGIVLVSLSRSLHTLVI